MTFFTCSEHSSCFFIDCLFFQLDLDCLLQSEQSYSFQLIFLMELTLAFLNFMIDFIIDNR